MLIRRPRRRVLAVAVGLCLAASSTAVAGTALTAPALAQSAGCEVDYVVQNQWPGGFTANLTITNLGQPVNGWQLTWTFAAGQEVAQGWNGSYSQSGSQVTVTDSGWNASLSTGGSTSTGFNGSWNNSANPVPTSFSLNGVACTGTAQPPPAPPPPGPQPPPPQPPPPQPPPPGPQPPPPPPPQGECGSGSFHAEVVQNGGTWTARNGGSTVYSGSDMRAAVQAGINSLSSGRTSKQSVVVRGSGSMSAGSRISVPSYTILDVCGTINVTGSGSGDQAPIYSRGTRDIEVRYLTLTGAPLYGIFMRNVDNLILGQIDMRLSGGLGVRIDNHGNRSVRSRNIRIDNVYVQGTGAHGVETYGVDGLTIGTVTARNTGYSGLLLNDTINATVGTVDAEGAGTGTGYAAFRMANRNGRVGSSYPTNIRVGTVIARGGGRGIFCVSESGGAVIDRVDIANTGNNSILIENCYNVTIAGVSGTISGGGEVRIAARSEFPASSDITLQNLTVSNTNIRWSPCSGSNNVIRNVTRNNSSLSWC